MIHSYTSRAVIIGFLSFLKNNYQLKKKKKKFLFQNEFSSRNKAFLYRFQERSHSKSKTELFF